MAGKRPVVESIPVVPVAPTPGVNPTVASTLPVTPAPVPATNPIISPEGLEPSGKAKKSEDEKAPIAESTIPGTGSSPPPAHGETHEDQKTEQKKADQTELFVGNLPYAASEEQIETFFTRFGPVTSVKLIQRVCSILVIS